MRLTKPPAFCKMFGMKIWAKIVLGDKIVRQTTYENPLPMRYDNYRVWVEDVCRLFDLSTPVILPAHYKNFAMFHNTRFKPDDFVDDLGADALVLEDCRE